MCLRIRRRCPAQIESSERNSVSQRRFQYEMVPGGQLVKGRGNLVTMGSSFHPALKSDAMGRRIFRKAPGHSWKRSADDLLRRIRELFTPMVLNPGEGGGYSFAPQETFATSGDIFSCLFGGMILALMGSRQGC